MKENERKMSWTWMVKMTVTSWWIWLVVYYEWDGDFDFMWFVTKSKWEIRNLREMQFSRWEKIRDLRDIRQSVLQVTYIFLFSFFNSISSVGFILLESNGSSNAAWCWGQSSARTVVVELIVRVGGNIRVFYD